MELDWTFRLSVFMVTAESASWIFGIVFLLALAVVYAIVSLH
jgi:hypothetical protein